MQVGGSSPAPGEAVDEPPPEGDSGGPLVVTFRDPGTKKLRRGSLQDAKASFAGRPREQVAADKKARAFFVDLTGERLECTTWAHVLLEELRALVADQRAAKLPGRAGLFVALRGAQVFADGGRDCAEFLNGHAETVSKVSRGVALWDLCGRALKACFWLMTGHRSEALHFVPELETALQFRETSERREVLRAELFRSAFPEGGAS